MISSSNGMAGVLEGASVVRRGVITGGVSTVRAITAGRGNGNKGSELRHLCSVRIHLEPKQRI